MYIAWKHFLTVSLKNSIKTKYLNSLISSSQCFLAWCLIPTVQFVDHWSITLLRLNVEALIYLINFCFLLLAYCYLTNLNVDCTHMTHHIFHYMYFALWYLILSYMLKIKVNIKMLCNLSALIALFIILTPLTF